MNHSELTPLEMEQLVCAVGGPAAARHLISGLTQYVEMMIGGAAYRPKSTCLNTLRDKGFIKDEVTAAVLESPAYDLTKLATHLKLVMLTPAALGLPDGGFYGDIVAASKTLRLSTCPEDTAACMMQQMSKPWSKYGAVVIATAPIVHHRVAHLFQITEGRLMVVPGDSGHHWGPTTRFLFRKL